jgi:hypothetical protein
MLDNRGLPTENIGYYLDPVVENIGYYLDPVVEYTGYYLDPVVENIGYYLDPVVENIGCDLGLVVGYTGGGLHLSFPCTSAYEAQPTVLHSPLAYNSLSFFIPPLQAIGRRVRLSFFEVSCGRTEDQCPCRLPPQ